MAQKKLKRFGEIKTFPNVLENPGNMKGKWESFFKNQNEIVLELACGKGEYATGLASIFPYRNFIGVDVKGNRLWVGAKYALQKQLKNVAFLRTQIDKITDYFSAGEVDEIWITFPDPQLRISKAKKRLTHPKFLRLYQQILKPGAKIHLKTDSPDLFNFTKLVIRLYNLKLNEEIDEVHELKPLPKELAITTHYEKLDIAKSNRVFYVSFSLPELIANRDEELKLLLSGENEEETI